MKSKFFNLLDPLLNIIDNGIMFKAPFRWLYIAIGIVALLIPLSFIINLSYTGVIRYAGFGMILFCLFTFLLLTAGGIGSFIFWVKRQNQIKENISINKHYMAVAMVSHFIKTFSEWLGLYIGIIGTLLALLMGLFSSSIIDLPLLDNISFSFMVVYPIIGFIIIISGHFFVEMLKVFTDIAENTRRN